MDQFCLYLDTLGEKANAANTPVMKGSMLYPDIACNSSESNTTIAGLNIRDYQYILHIQQCM